MSYKKHGGLRFLTVGRIGVTFCVKRDALPMWTFGRLCWLAPALGVACAELATRI